MTDYTVVIERGTTSVQADGFRTDNDGGLYFYCDGLDDPVAYFPSGHYLAVLMDNNGKYLD